MKQGSQLNTPWTWNPNRYEIGFQWHWFHTWTLHGLETQIFEFYFNEIGFRIQHPMRLKSGSFIYPLDFKSMGCWILKPVSLKSISYLSIGFQRFHSWIRLHAGHGFEIQSMWFQWKRFHSFQTHLPDFSFLNSSCSSGWKPLRSDVKMQRLKQLNFVICKKRKNSNNWAVRKFTFL